MKQLITLAILAIASCRNPGPQGEVKQGTDKTQKATENTLEKSPDSSTPVNINPAGKSAAQPYSGNKSTISDSAAEGRSNNKTPGTRKTVVQYNAGQKAFLNDSAAEAPRRH